jgi:STE24 endopeptidase
VIACNGLMAFFLSVFVASALAQGALRWLNLRHLRSHGSDVPAVFAGQIDRETLARISRYTQDTSRFGMAEGFFDDAATLAVLLSGILPWLVGVLPAWEERYLPAGLGLFAVLALGSGLLGLPFDLYRTFIIERRHGFSTITLRLWLSDLLKGLAVSAILLGLLLAAFLTLLRYTPASWWFWTWLVFALFQLLMLWLYPVAIAPLFNRYEPIRDEALKEALVELMARAGLRTEGVYQVDAGRRSRHTNAYFTGLGRSKRIVLYDTLIASHTRDEIVAVLAHEIGHWKKRHVAKQLLAIGAASLLALWLASHLIAWPVLYTTFGFEGPLAHVGLLLAGALLGPFWILFTPLLTGWQRRHEREADDFVGQITGTTAPLASALRRLACDNLANLHPHPLYARFFYSHPPLAERIARLEGLDSGQIAP